MPFDSKILLDKIKSLKQNVQEANFSEVFVAALNTGNALMQQRIFNQNTDIEGNSFGGYVGEQKFLSQRQKKRLLGSTTSRTDLGRIQKNLGLRLTPYQRKRVNKGRQIIKKDLEFSGGLRRAIEIQVINERSVALQFNNDEAVKVAKGQENQITNLRNGEKGYVTGNGIKIFAFNDNEKERTSEQVRLLIKQIL